MHNLSAVFNDVNIHSSLTQFTEAHLDRLETSLFDKNGKTRLKYLATGKDKLAKPEEIIRKLWLLELTESYGYPTDIADFTIWRAPEAVQQEIRQAVENGFAAKQRATQLLEAAKRAVEITIEDTEAAALNYLDKILQDTGDH